MECSGGEFAKVSCAPPLMDSAPVFEEWVYSDKNAGFILHRRRWI